MSGSNGKRRGDRILSPDFATPRLRGSLSERVGVLALQGDFREHRIVLDSLGVATREVRKVGDLDDLDGLVIPGGESTTIGKLMWEYGLVEAIRGFAAAGRPVYGSCAGLIALATGIVDGGQPLLGLIDIVARRNAFGRQVHSFEVDLEVVGLRGPPLHAVFIRAPWIESAGPGVEILASYEGHGVAARQGTVLVTAFHPELTGDRRVHAQFLEMVRAARAGASGAAVRTISATSEEVVS